MNAEALFQQTYKRPYTASPQDMEMMTQLLTRPAPSPALQGQGPILGPQDTQTLPSVPTAPGPSVSPEPQGFSQLLQAPLSVEDRIHELNMARGHREADAEYRARMDVRTPALAQGQIPEQTDPVLVDVTGKQVPKDPPYTPAPQAPMNMAQVLQPQLQISTPQVSTPPANPQEFEQRRQGWRQILTGFMQQPNADQILMQVGLKLLQGRQPGETLGQQFGGAISTGVQASAMLNENAKADQDRLRKQEAEKQRHDLEMRKGTAQADKAEAENDFYAKTRAQAMEEINLGIENLKRKGKFEDARLVEQEFNNGNLKAAWDLARRDKENAMWARTQQVKIQQKNADKVPAAGQARADLLQLVKDAYPQEPSETEMQYKQRIARIQLQINGTSKANTVTDLLKVAELTEDDGEREALRQQALAQLQGRQIPAAHAPAAGRGGTKTSTAQKADWIRRAQAANPGTPLAEIQRRADEKFK